MRRLPVITEDVVAEFEELLRDSSEQDMQTFLEDNPRLMEFLTWEGLLKGKYRLADAFVPDFISVGLEPYTNAPKPLVYFVEIERAAIPLFTKSGNPSSSLTHAIRQVQDWKRWVNDNRTYLQMALQKLVTIEESVSSEDSDEQDVQWRRRHLTERIVHGFLDRYLVIMGRRHTMNISNRLHLSQMNEDLDRIRIITYDVLLEHLVRMFEYERSAKSRDEGDRWLGNGLSE